MNNAGPHRGNTPDRIAGAALALLAEHGLAGITMSAIATRAGIARQTLYNHYPDVDSILAAVLLAHEDADIQGLITMLGTIPTATGRLEHIVRHTAVTAAQHGSLPVLHDGLSPAAQRARDSHQERIQGVIRDVLVAGRDSGEFRSTLDPALDCVLIHRLLRGAAELAAAQPDRIADIADAAVRTVRAATQAWNRDPPALR